MHWLVGVGGITSSYFRAFQSSRQLFYMHLNKNDAGIVQKSDLASGCENVKKNSLWIWNDLGFLKF